MITNLQIFLLTQPRTSLREGVQKRDNLKITVSDILSERTVVRCTAEALHETAGVAFCEMAYLLLLTSPNPFRSPYKRGREKISSGIAL